MVEYIYFMLSAFRSFPECTAGEAIELETVANKATVTI